MDWRGCPERIFLTEVNEGNEAAKEHTEAEPQPNNRKSHSKDIARTSSQQDRKGHKD
jgi:hypothetical protein